MCRKNRNNIPVLDGDRDLYSFFEEEQCFEDEEEQCFEDKDNTNTIHDSSGAFEHDVIDHEDEDFALLLDSSLKGMTMQDIMRAKKDRQKSKPISLKARLKRYPPPQKTLDLHGETASIAEIKTESYIKKCRRDGIFTLQIVVGKGLHSQWGPVLPDIIEDLLIKLKKDGIVLWFRWDRKKKSQSGALIVYIKHFRD